MFVFVVVDFDIDVVVVFCSWFINSCNGCIVSSDITFLLNIFIMTLVVLVMKAIVFPSLLFFLL